jgi:hypothetical protein
VLLGARLQSRLTDTRGAQGGILVRTTVSGLMNLGTNIVLGFVVTLVGGLLVVALYKWRVEPSPEQKEQFKAREPTQATITDGEIGASLRRSRSLMGLIWRSGALIAQDGEVWWESRILRRVVPLTGASLLDLECTSPLDAIQLAGRGWQIVDIQQDGRRIRLAVERDTADFVRSRFTPVA